jgi:dTDP-glucose 4,6-dehydratase
VVFPGPLGVPMNDAPRRVVVTGGAGFVGSWLCEELLRRGSAVVCVDNYLTGSRENVEHLAETPGFELMVADVSDELEIAGPVDMVLHLASPASPVHYQRHPIATLRVGSLGTMNALELARCNDARFVLASTSEIYGDPLQHPQREDYWGNVNSVGPRSMYDEAKRFAEAWTTAYRGAHGVRTAIARIFNTYGPRMSVDDGRVVPTFVSQALAGEALTVAGDGSQTRSICHVSDTVGGLVALAMSEHPGPVNIGNPAELTVLSLAERIITLAASGSGLEFVPLPIDDPQRRCPDISRARELLGWSPRVASTEGLMETIEWFRQR